MKKDDRLMPPIEALKEPDMGYYTYRVAAALMVFLMIVGSSLAGTHDINPGQDAILYTSDTKDDVQGHGYVMEYKKINTNNLSMLDYSHGSGSMDFADIEHSEQTTDTSGMYLYYVLDYTTGKWEAAQTGGSSKINYTKQYDNVYAPTTFAYGTGWYASHPITYNSLLKEKNDAKSYQEGISMERQVEYAHALKGDIAVAINCTGPTSPIISGEGLLKMKIEDNMTDGTMHIGELVSPLLDDFGYLRSWKVQGVKNPIIERDVNYVGDFRVQKNMKVSMPKYPAMQGTDWLSCSCEGFIGIPDYNTIYAGQMSIFDGTFNRTVLNTYTPVLSLNMSKKVGDDKQM